MSVHWRFTDLAATERDEERRYRAFKVTAKQLMTRIRYLLILIERLRSEAA